MAISSRDQVIAELVRLWFSSIVAVLVLDLDLDLGSLICVLVCVLKIDLDRR
jgi:hypothetical protein